MTDEQKLDNIILNENAYFFHNINNIQFTDAKIIELFRIASTTKSSNYLLKEIRKNFSFEGIEINYSFCVFKYQTKPTFIDEEIENWTETKLAYLLISEIEDYIIICRKNISNIQKFIKQFNALDYKTLSTLFVDEETTFEKFGLKNMNVSDNALREKSLEAINLKENFSALGASTYILNSVRLKNNDEKISLILNSSRINKFGKKNNIEDFLSWGKKLVDEIKAHSEKETFLSVFAEPQDYESIRHTLEPISTLFIFSNLYSDFETGKINRAVVKFEDIKKEINILKYLSNFERLLKVYEFIDDDSIISYFVENKTSKDLEVRLNEKSITFRSRKLKNVILENENGTEISILDYINYKSGFIINFDSIDLAYTNRKLFKDSKLLGNIDYFLKIFKPFENLNNVTSEKGNFVVGQSTFEDNSIFNFVENEFIDNSEYLICDDLGREWADHISVTEDKIIFYHSKYKASNFSASDFQDIVGQAQKNLGNLSPQDFQLSTKESFWNNNYNSSNGINTNIRRIRKGSNATDAISQIKNTIKNPHFKREVHIVINFISKVHLTENLEKLKNGTTFGERSETIQILWFISSLNSSCQEVNTDIYICCKP